MPTPHKRPAPSPNSEPSASKTQQRREEALRAEQRYLDGLFQRLDSEVAAARERLRRIQRAVDPHNPDAEALVRRETEYHAVNATIDRLNLAQLGLVFGRIDVHEPQPNFREHPVPGHDDLDRRYIGRQGLVDKQDNYKSLLIDWRAPLARPFYLATTVHPEGVEVRRHIRTKGRQVVGIHDELLGAGHADQLAVSPTDGDAGVVGTAAADATSESPLREALQAARSEHMRSIVSTIQREQDEIIRDPTRGVMVVEGGPGTGKTAVALHRIAYLLYTWRAQLAKQGVLILGPNQTFLEYISRVLPELGETGVVLSTVGELYPGVTGVAERDPLTREVKGSVEMCVLLKRVVQRHQRIPNESLQLSVEGIALTVPPALFKAARTRARRSRRPHNMAQPAYREALTERLTQLLVETIGADPLGGANLLGAGDAASLHDELLEDPAVDALVEEYWPLLSPEACLRELLERPDVLAEVASDYDDDTQRALAREPGAPITAADTPLLDELAQLIGLEDPEQRREEEDRRWKQQVAEAAEALDVLAGSANTDLDDETEAEILSAHDVIDASTLAQRQQASDQRTTAQRAREDHQWAYGHVIIDEAQELTPMAWRMVMRRCPARWMTLVGDLCQTSEPAGVDDWAEALAPFVGNRFRSHRLTVNYRTPAPVMRVADQLLQRFAPHAPTSQPLRTHGAPVQWHTHLEDGLRSLLQRLHDEPERLGCVIVPETSSVDETLQDLQSVQVLGVTEAKGLEFDHVLVADPLRIVEESPQGNQDLFVALTRATQTLTIAGECGDLFEPTD